MTSNHPFRRLTHMLCAAVFVLTLNSGAAQTEPQEPSATFTVNTTADTLDASTGNGICADSGGSGFYGGAGVTGGGIVSGNGILTLIIVTVNNNHTAGGQAPSSAGGNGGGIWCSGTINATILTLINNVTGNGASRTWRSAAWCERG